MQKFTSAKTSINKNRIPVLFSKVDFTGVESILDYGGGKFDNTKNLFQSKGKKFFVYDKFNRSEKHNESVLRAVQGGVDIVTCSNVLNVIDSHTARLQVIKDCYNYTKDKAVFTVYEGDKTGIGRSTQKDCFQLNRKTKDYLEEISSVFSKVEIKNNVIYASK